MNTWRFLTSTVCPSTAMTRLMKSLERSFGQMNTTTSPGRGFAQPRQPAERHLRQRDLQARAVEELVHQDVVADLERRQHRAGRDLERLHHERPDRQREEQGDAERLDVLAEL